jgi:iron-sulfur cluster assembly protein
VLELTEAAQDAVREMVEAEGAADGAGLRIVAETDDGGGEASLALDIAAGPEDGDVVVEAGGARVFLDQAVAPLLDDQVLDAHEHDDHFHFAIEPQASPNGDGGR